MNQDFKRLLKNKQVLKAAASCLVLLVLTISAAALLGDRTAAWFSNNKNVNAGGMTVSVANERYRFDDSFSVKAMLNNVELASTTYKRSGLGTDFYLVDENGDFVKNGENYQPPFFDSLFPGEYLEFTFRITCTEGMKNRGYRILFRDFGKEADTLFTTVAVGAAPAATYSVLGVFCVKQVTDETTAGDGAFLTSYENGAATPEEVTVPDFVLAAEGDFTNADADGFVTVKIRLTVNLSQYTKLSGTTSNLLSEKIIRIGSVYLGPKEEANG